MRGEYDGGYVLVLCGAGLSCPAHTDNHLLHCDGEGFGLHVSAAGGCNCDGVGACCRTTSLGGTTTAAASAASHFGGEEYQQHDPQASDAATATRHTEEEDAGEQPTGACNQPACSATWPGRWISQCARNTVRSGGLHCKRGGAGSIRYGVRTKGAARRRSATAGDRAGKRHRTSEASGWGNSDR